MLSKRHQKPPKKFKRLFSRPKTALVSRSETTPKTRAKTTIFGCCCCCCCWSSSSSSSFTNTKRLSSFRIGKTIREIFVLRGTISSLARKKRLLLLLLTTIQKKKRRRRKSAKDDDAPRRPSWRPVRRTRLAGRTRARRRPDYTLAFFVLIN